MFYYFQVFALAFKVLALLEGSTPTPEQVTTYQIGPDKFSLSISSEANTNPVPGSEPVSVNTIVQFIFEAIGTIMVTGSVSQVFWVKSPLGGDLNFTVALNKVTTG